MKRLNPKTNAPFKRGEQREDGKYFLGYQNKVSKKTGLFYENWGCGSYLKNYHKARYDSHRAEYLLTNARMRATRNNALCTITKTWVAQKLETGVCELTGLPFSLESNLEDTKNNPYAPSLDRINSKDKNYTPQNTRMVLSFVNIAINDLGLEKAIPIFKALIENYEKNKPNNQPTV